MTRPHRSTDHTHHAGSSLAVFAFVAACGGSRMQPADIEAVKTAAAEGAAEAIRKANAAGIAEAEGRGPRTWRRSASTSRRSKPSRSARLSSASPSSRIWPRSNPTHSQPRGGAGTGTGTMARERSAPTDARRRRHACGPVSLGSVRRSRDPLSLSANERRSALRGVGGR